MKKRLQVALPIIAIISVFVCIVWAGVISLAAQAKFIEVERCYASTKQLAKVFAEQVARTIDNVERLIDFAAFEFFIDGRMYSNSSGVNIGVSSAGPVVQIAFVDTEGFTLATNVGPDTARTDLRDREHIRVHLDNNTDGLFIGTPVLGRVSGKWSIQFTRKIFDQNKKFVGIVVASVDPFYFQRFWKDTLLPGELVTLVRSDGTLLTRSSDLQLMLAKKPPTTWLDSLVAGHSEGRFAAKSLDGKERLGFFTRVNDLPLFVLSGEDTSASKDSFASRQKELYLVGSILTLILLGLGGWLYVFASRLRRQEEISRRAEQAKSSFLAVMSHEIRTPLSALIGFSNLLRKTTLNEEQKSYIETIDISAKNLRNIVTDVLDFSKLEVGALEIEKGPFNLHECCIQLQKITSILIAEKPINLRIMRSMNFPETVILDGPRLYQVLMNLCSNAAKFTQAGEIVISGSVTKQDGVELLVVEVSDTGPGISKDAQSKLFTPFEQGQLSGELRAAGTGLGLTICKALLEKMDGSIHVESVPGQGSTFRIELPFLRSNDAVASPMISSREPEITPLRILVADDARASRMLLRIILQQKGHSVVEAEDGVQALEFMQDGDFDIAFLDMQMPRLGGLDVARRMLKAESSRAAPMMVALSALAQKEDKIAAAEVGIDHYMTKPISENDLSKVLGISMKARAAVYSMPR